MNKSQLIESLARHFDGSKREASHALDSVIDVIERELVKGEKVAITGFGAFEKIARPSRMVRNPRTGERKRAKKTAVPKFKAGADLKKLMSGEKKLPKVSTVKAVPSARAAAGRSTATKATTGKASTSRATSSRASTAKTTTPRSSAAKSASTNSPAAKKTTSGPATKTATKSTAASRSTTAGSPSKRSSATKSSTTTTKPVAKSTAAKSTAAKSTASSKAPASSTAKKTTTAASKRTAKKS